MKLSKLTRSPYGLARLSNKARIAERFLEGNPAPLLKHERDKVYFRLFGRFLK